MTNKQASDFMWSVFKELECHGVWYYAHRAEVEAFLRGRK
jgi:hypothetical protein